MSVDEIAAAIEGLSFSEKLDLMERLSSSIRRAGGNRSTAKISKGSNKSNKPKRTAALGTLAWTAYTKHAKETMPKAFEGISKESEKLSIVKGLRAKDPEGYERFVQNWKASHENSGAAGGGEMPSTEAREWGQIQRDARLKAYSKLSSPSANLVAAEKKAVKTVKKLSSVSKSEVPKMPQIVIDGTKYWHNADSNGLWEVTGENVPTGTGSWVGYLQPGNNLEPIRRTEAFGSERKSRKTRKNRK